VRSVSTGDSRTAPPAWVTAWGLALFALALTLLGRSLFELWRWSATEMTSTWAFTDLLINYQAGFVRRGLLGELLFVGAGVGVTPERAAWWIGWGLFSINLAVLLLALRRYVTTAALPALALMLLSPALLMFAAGDAAAFARKETVLLLPLLAHLEWLRRCRIADRESPYLRGLLLIVFPLFALSALVHEITLLSLPLHGWLTWRQRRSMNPLALLAVYGGLALALTPTWLVHGDLETARAICRSWAQVGLAAECTFPPGGIGALARDFTYAWWLFTRLLAQPDKLLHWAALLAVSFAGLFASAVWLGVATARRRLALAVALGAFSLLAPIGWDWGRWLSLSAFVFVLLAFHPALDDNPPTNARCAPNMRIALLLTGLLALQSVIGVPHCCLEKYPGFFGPAVRFAQSLSR
jgi:hypothetical protein